MLTINTNGTLLKNLQHSAAVIITSRFASYYATSRCCPLCVGHAALQNPHLPRCWWEPGQPVTKQQFKPHQLTGVRFLWNNLVVEHAVSPGQQQQQPGDGEQSDDDFMAAGTADDPISINGGGGGCILAHSMGEWGCMVFSYGELG